MKRVFPLIAILCLFVLIAPATEARRRRGRYRIVAPQTTAITNNNDNGPTNHVRDVEEEVVVPENGEDAQTNRTGKLLPLFSVVRFPNDPCRGSTGRNGTCYTLDECAARSGVKAGSCAQGFGVCCTFTASCGATSSENCTYVESSGGETGSCSVKICRCSNNICQLRLDFETFQITGPSTSTVSITKTVFGSPSFSTGVGASSSSASQCLTDQFSVLVPGGNAPPTICGLNTGEHMYVDIGSCGCNDLVFQLGNNNAIANRAWSIKVSQYDCDYENLAPQGCTQYFFGSSSQTVRTYNFLGGMHLAEQNQNICVRRERGNCRICWTTAAPTDFATSGTSSTAGFVTQSLCCGYLSSGVGTFGYDCVTIPGALKVTSMSNPGASRICGRNVGLVTTFTSATAMTVCSTRAPFSIRFLSDKYEIAGDSAEAANKDIGFQLTYIQSSNNC